MNSGEDACPWIPVTATRRALREKYGLPEEPSDDCSVIFFCAPCSVCQAARELKARNYILGEHFGFLVETQNKFVLEQPNYISSHIPSIVSTEPNRIVRQTQPSE